TLALVGRRPPEWLAARVATMPGVRVYADVPDVRPFLATCGMLVVPLRIGGGSRLKILEALATETPVVSTRIGAEGLQLTPKRDLIVTETPGEMVTAIVSSMQAVDELQETAERGRREVLKRYSWDPLADRLANVWQSVTRHSVRLPA
ncbi:MAG TPA: glycosyltransferase, partial [Gemmata sp.]|nr:glycosyltransferase [Gemmata sp.]